MTGVQTCALPICFPVTILPVILNASTSSGFVQSADTSGVLTIQNNGTDALTVSSGNLQFNSGYGSVATAYGCRAWVNFNGTGTVAIRASGNVSSITDNGTGDYTVNFSTAMPDTNYSVSGLGQFDQSPSASSPALVSIYRSSTALQTNSCRVLSSNSNSTSTVDFPTVTLAVFR